MHTSEVRAQLAALADPQYRAFHERIVPGVQGIHGVRMPHMRAIAKQIARDGLDEFVAGDAYEEVMLEGLALGYAKLSLDERLARLERFVPKIDNWAVCDSCTMSYKFMARARETVWPWLMTWLDHENPFAQRFVLVALLAHFVTDDTIERVFDVVDNVRSEHYYVRMAAAWLISVCYIEYPERTRAYLQQDHLDDFTHDKAIAKIRESIRPSKQEKQSLLLLKRKGVDVGDAQGALPPENPRQGA